MKKKGKIFIGAAVILVAGLVVMRLMKPEEELVTRQTPSVTVTRLEKGSIESETSLMGSVQPSDTYYVIPKVAGEITKIYVQNGDYVEAGDAICEIDNAKQIDAAKIQLESAQVSYQTARTSLERMVPLYQAGDVSAQTYEQTKAQVDGAKLQMDAAQLQYDTQVEFATVTAPAAGVIQNASMTLNGMASQQSQLCVITADGAKTVHFNVTERVLENISVGDAVTVEKQGSSYSGTITDLSTLVNQQTGLFAVEAALSDAQGLADGVRCKVYLVSERAEDAELIPVDCVYYTGGDAYVYTYVDGVVEKAYVTLGISDGTNVVVLDGLTAEDEVISSWTQELYEGAAVKLAETGAEQTEESETTADAA